MRRLLPCLLAALALSWGASRSQAQITPFGSDASDPFFLYYGFFLPRQAQLAAQPRVDAAIQQRAVDQQFRSETDRAGLYDDIPVLGESELDPLRPFNRRSTYRAALSPTGVSNSNLRGFGPSAYYGRVTSYYPSYTIGRASNANVARIRSRRGGMRRGGGMRGGMGMGGMRGGMGMGGMRGGMGMGGMGGGMGMGGLGGGGNTPKPGIASTRR